MPDAGPDRPQNAPTGATRPDPVNFPAVQRALRAAVALEQRPPLIPVGALTFLSTDVPNLDPLLDPWLREKTLAMVHAWRGVGKTWFSLGVAMAVSTGGEFLGWRAPRRRRVLFVDGEMPAKLLQERLRRIARANDRMPEDGELTLVTPDLQEAAMPNLAELEGQALLDACVAKDTALIVIDNWSALVRSGAENEAESVSNVMQWALAHRRAGRAVLFIHHSGKSGAQRGTSKREDLLDVVLALRRPPDYGETEGARFEIHPEKTRSMSGGELEPIEAALEVTTDGGAAWTWHAVASATAERIRGLWNLGALSLTDIAREVDRHKSNVVRTLQHAAQRGELTRPYPPQRPSQRKRNDEAQPSERTGKT